MLRLRRVLFLLPFAVTLACTGEPSTPSAVPEIQELERFEAPAGIDTPAPAGATVQATDTKGAALAVEEPELTEGLDVSALVRDYNSASYDAPPRQFRAGHVTPRTLAPSAIQVQPGQFRVKLPSAAPITTPAVHAGYVVTSGGFHSKELYAFEAKSGTLAWAVDLDDDGPSAPACEDRVCVFNTESCTVFALAVDTGKPLWSWWLGDPLTSAPTIANGLVFTSYPALGSSANVHPAPTGSNRGSVAPTPSSKGRPPQQSHALAAFDLHTGELHWTRWIDSDVMSAPVAVGSSLYATTFAGTIYKFDQKTGEILAARQARATSAPVIVGDDVFYTQRTDKGAASPAEEAIARDNAKTPQKKYVAAKKRADYLDARAQRASSYASKGKSLDASNGFSAGAPVSANAQTAEGNIGQASVSTLQAFQGSRIVNLAGMNISTMGDEVVAIDGETGRARWKQRLQGDLAGAGGALATAPAAAGHRIFVGTLDGHVLQLDPKTGATERRYPVGAAIRAQPVIEDGWLYVGTEDGQLVAIDTGDPALRGWSQWGGNAQRTGARAVSRAKR